LLVDGGNLSINNDLTLDGGSISVQGANLNLNTGNLTVQAGTLTIDGGSQMNIGGRLTMSGGSVVVQGVMQLNSGGEVMVDFDQLQINGGTLDINGGATVTVGGGTLNVNALGTLNVNTSGTLITSSGTTTNRGTFTSRGSVSITGTGVLENNNAGIFALSASTSVPVSFDPKINDHTNNYNTLFAHTPVSYSASSLPSGLTISTSTGQITGTAVATGTGSFYVVSTSTVRTARQKFAYTIGVSDSVAPTITNVVSSVSTSSVTITWSTNEAASTRVSFGLTSAYGITTSEFDTAPRVTNHSINITSLVPCTTYHYQVVSRDAALNTSSSSDATFATAGCPGEAPVESSTTTISIISATGGTVSFDAGVGRTLELNVPALFTSSTSAQFSIKELNSAVLYGAIGKPSGVASVGDGFDIKALTSATSTVSTFDNPIEISISYTHAEIVNIIESSLKIYSHNGSTWSVLTNCVVNAVSDIVTCSTNHFSVFALFGTSIVSAASNTSGSASPSGGSSGGTFALLPIKPQVATSTVVSTTSPFIFTKNMTIGSRGVSVQYLQRYLNSRGFIVAVEGAGSPGKESLYFGSRTAQALKKFQASMHLPPTGFFGPLTRKSISII
jgi:hypothetical protein